MFACRPAIFGEAAVARCWRRIPSGLFHERSQSPSLRSRASRPRMPASVAAAEQALALARRAPAAAVCSCCSRAAPPRCSPRQSTGSTLADKIETSRRLMNAGAAIHELNCVRKHLSRIKGGKLAAAAAGRTITLALSDVHGRSPTTHPSSDPARPCPMQTTFADALDIVTRYRDRAAARRSRPLWSAASGARWRKRSSPEIPRIDASTFVGDWQPPDGGRRARRAAEAARYTVVVTFADPTTGEARVWPARHFVEAAALRAPGASHARSASSARAKRRSRSGAPASAAATRSSRWQVRRRCRLEAQAAASPFWRARAPTASMAQPTPPAPSSTARRCPVAQRRARLAGGARAQRCLSFCRRVGALIMWGPTGTNVGDLHVLLIVEPPLQSSL